MTQDRATRIAQLNDEFRRVAIDAALGQAPPQPIGGRLLVTQGIHALPPDEQTARDTEQVSVHCDALPAEMAPGMVEAQRLRDAALADAALAALSDTGGPVVVIAGAGHARTDWGVPALIARAAPEVRVLSVGQIEVAPGDPAPDASSTNGPPFDLWIATPPADRDDPCAAFR